MLLLGNPARSTRAIMGGVLYGPCTMHLRSRSRPLVQYMLGMWHRCAGAIPSLHPQWVCWCLRIVRVINQSWAAINGVKHL
jgi:hypothetical protein